MNLKEIGKEIGCTIVGVSYVLLMCVVWGAFWPIICVLIFFDTLVRFNRKNR